MIRIFVADDHSLFRDGVISLLEAGGHIVVGQAGDGLAAIELVRSMKPDLVLMDISMPRMDGIEALRQIKSSSPEVNVIMLTVSEDEANLVQAIRTGADGYLLKHLNAKDFLEMVNGLERGEAAITRSLTMRLLKHMITPEPASKRVLLSDRELEILQLVAMNQIDLIEPQPQIAQETLRITHHVLELAMALRGNGRADENNVLIGVASEQHLERREQRHEKSSTLLTAECFERFGELSRQHN